MLITALLLTVLSAPPKVAAARFAVVDLSEARADFYTEHFADRLADQGLRVVTPREVATIVGMDRQRALLGCAEAAASCLVEMANALGVDAVVLGTVAKVGSEFQVNLKIIAAENGRRLAAFSTKVASEGQVVDALTSAAPAMAKELAAALGRPLQEKTASASASPGARGLWWLPATVGVLALAGGTVGLVSAESARAKLASGEPVPNAAAVLESGQTARTLGWVGLGVGVLAVGTTVGFLLSGSSSSNVVPVAALTGDGASIGVVGRLP